MFGNITDVQLVQNHDQYVSLGWSIIIPPTPPSTRKYFFLTTILFLSFNNLPYFKMHDIQDL